MIAGAVISACGLFRYHLHRRWDPTLPVLLFVMLNPSTADGSADDATIRRCIAFAKTHGFGGIEVVNLFGFRATKPRELTLTRDPVGRYNDHWVRQAAEAVHAARGKVCVAWGAHKEAERRANVVMPMLRQIGIEPQCLGVTRSGYPSHPLMLPRTAHLRRFDEAAIQEAMNG